MNRRRPPIPTARTVADAMRILAELTGRVAELTDEVQRVRHALEALAGADVVDAPAPGPEPPPPPDGEQPAPQSRVEGPAVLHWENDLPEVVRALVARAILANFLASTHPLTALVVVLPNSRALLARPGAIQVEERASAVSRLRIASHLPELAEQIERCPGLAIVLVEPEGTRRVLSWGDATVPALRELATLASRAKQAAEAEAKRASEVAEEARR